MPDQDSDRLTVKSVISAEYSIGPSGLAFWMEEQDMSEVT